MPTGPLPATIKEIIKIANEQEQMYVSLGNVGQEQLQFEKAIEQGGLAAFKAAALERLGPPPAVAVTPE